MSTQPPLLEARNLGRRHPDGRSWLLEDVSLLIEPGMRLALVGPSGAGKTLLLRALALLDPLDSGDVRFRGTNVRRDGVPPFRREVHYLHQRAALLDDTVEAALRRPFTLKCRLQQQFQQPRAVEILERLGRDASFLAKNVSDLSGGEIQITALIRALQLEPTVLLLDEPTAALDAQAASAVEDLLQHWISQQAAARAMVWVSHDRQQAGRVAQTVVSIEAGRICNPNTLPSPIGS
ncbi:MAG: ATP-binding cassette domain-containing protein [Thermoguttaceae bacterium]